MWLLYHIATTEHEGFPTDAGKVVYDFMIEEISVVRQNLLQQSSQVGLIPLSIPEDIHKPVQRGLWLNFKGLVECVICHQNMQVGVQYQHRFRHGFDDGLGKLASKHQF